jgi:hypothetical protein
MRLSDFQIPDAPIRVDAELMKRNATSASSTVDWKKGRVPVKPGTDDLDLLQRYGRDNASDEPVESDSDEEPDEAADAMDAFQTFLTVLTDSNSTLKNSAHDVVTNVKRDRQRLAAVGRGAAQVIASPHRVKINHNAGYITDSDYISKFLHPDMLCIEAENQLHDISLERQKNNANRGFWSGLYFFLREQPEGTRIRDVQNKACLSTLVANTLGGRPVPFGV